MTAKKGVAHSEAPRRQSQPVCVVCKHTFVSRAGQTCEACRRKKKTRQHTLDQQKLGRG